MQLEDKIALVTGAGRGMGRAISLQLAEAGANIAVSDIDASTAEDTAVAVKQLGRESIVLPADMGDLRDIDRMFSQAKDAFGRIDIVVNNAGVTKYLDIMDVQEEDWDRIHRVNAKGVFFCMQRAARDLIDQGQGGRIINIASIAGKGYAGTSNAAYAASKGAVISMTHIAALQLGQYDINVNAICPGSTLTTAKVRRQVVERLHHLNLELRRQSPESVGLSLDQDALRIIIQQLSALLLHPAATVANVTTVSGA